MTRKRLFAINENDDAIGSAKLVDVMAPKQETDKILIVLCGLPGCGKSMITSILNNPKIISADKLRYNDKGEYNYDADKDSDIFQQTYDMCEKYMESGETPIVIDNTNCHINHAKEYVDMAAKYDYKISKLFIPCSVKDSLARNKHEVPESTIGMMKKNLLDHFGEETNR